MSITGWIKFDSATTSGGGEVWTNPANGINCSDANFAYHATAGGFSNYLHGYNLQSTPQVKGKLLGIECRIRGAQNTTTHYVSNISLVWNGALTGTGKTPNTNFPASVGDMGPWGGSSDLWGSTIGIANLRQNPELFGFAVKSYQATGGFAGTKGVSCMEARFYYEGGGMLIAM